MSTNSGSVNLNWYLHFLTSKKCSNFGQNISRKNTTNSGRPHDQTPGVCVPIPNYLCNLKNAEVSTWLESSQILNIVDLIGLNKHNISGSEPRAAPPNKSNKCSPPFIPTPENGGKLSLRKDLGDFWRQTIDDVQNYSHDSDISVLIILLQGGSVSNSHLATCKST